MWPLKDALEGMIKEDGWLEAARELTGRVEPLGRLVDELDLEVNVEDEFPRLCYLMDYELLPRREHVSAQEEQTDNLERVDETEDEKQENETKGEEVDEGDARRFPNSPRQTKE
jgi:hypothetical protein